MNHSNHDRLGALVGRNRSALGHGLAARASGDGAGPSSPSRGSAGASVSSLLASDSCQCHYSVTSSDDEPSLKYAFGSVDSFEPQC